MPRPQWISADKTRSLFNPRFHIRSALTTPASFFSQQQHPAYLSRFSNQRTFSATPTPSLPALTKLIETMTESNINDNTPRHFLDRNNCFAAECDPGMLAAAATGQTPRLFWLGCSDSRVPEGLVIRAGMGEVFVHRNVANLFGHSDNSAVAAIAYAVDVLKVPHVAVVGHENCGGCAAALAAATATTIATPPPHVSDVGVQAIKNWIEPIRKLAVEEVKKNPENPLSEVVSANVRAQVANLASHPVVQEAWNNGQELILHGWVYDLATGKINDLNVTRSGN